MTLKEKKARIRYLTAKLNRLAKSSEKIQSSKSDPLNICVKVSANVVKALCIINEIRLLQSQQVPKYPSGGVSTERELVKSKRGVQYYSITDIKSNQCP